MAAFEKKIKIAGTICFETAFHIGSGREGELASDMGVLKDIDGRPVLPGSTLKGCIRSMAERLAPHLGMTACLLDSSISGVDCITDEPYRKKVVDSFRKLSEPDKLPWLQGHTCQVCQLFGSPLRAGRIFFSDGGLAAWSGTYEIRDGVCIDRDSETARHGLKFDFEIVPQGTTFSISIELDDPQDIELALVGAVLAELETGFHLGGFTSRGLGRARLTQTSVSMVDYGNSEMLKNYLLNRAMQTMDSTLFMKPLETVLQQKGEAHA